jgi:hypothetical protein
MTAADDTAIKAANAGRGYGVCALGGFGALWLYNALILSHQPQWTLTVMWVAAIALVLGGVLITRTAKTVRDEAPRDPAVAQWFWIVFGVEFAAIAAVVVLFQMWHLDPYVIPAVAIIVGIHFLPLARLFRAPIYNVTGILMTLWATALIFAVPDELQRTILVAFGTGAILWASAVIVLAVPRR